MGGWGGGIFVFGSFHLPSVSPRRVFVCSAKHAETAALYTKLTSDKRSLFPALAPPINNGNNDFVGFLLPSGIFWDRLGALRTDAHYFSSLLSPPSGIYLKDFYPKPKHANGA